MLQHIYDSNFQGYDFYGGHPAYEAAPAYAGGDLGAEPAVDAQERSWVDPSLLNNLPSMLSLDYA